MSFIIAVLSIETLGILAVLLIGRLLKYKFALIELFSIAFFIGLGVIGYLQFLSFLLGIKISAGLAVTLAIAAFVILLPGIAGSKRYIIEFRKPAAFSCFEKIILSVLFLQAAWVIFQALPLPINSYDSLANFGFKAKIFYLDNGIPDGFFQWNEYTVSHPDYPPLLPLILTWVYYFIGFNDLLVAKIMPVAYLIFLPFFYFLLRRFFMRIYALAAVLVFATIPQVSRYAMITYADLLLGIFVSIAFTYFMLYLRDKEAAYLVFSALFFGFSAWVKNESLVFICVFFLLLIFCLGRLRDAPRFIKHLLLALLVFFAASSPWLIFKFFNGLVNSDINIVHLGRERFLQNLKDSWLVFYNLQMEFFNLKKWNIFWVIVLLTLILKRKNIFKGLAAYAVFFISIAALGYFGAYLFTTNYNIDFYVSKTISRFMLHFCGLFIFLVLYLIDEAKIKPSGYEEY
ncbi:MAG: glycosyltransferase family 39 protein [Candidatus Omnitrophica bacterium]|nr:glycosyltransferase family 39 protein [Candidatus Omnitrophota bacterium]